MLAAPHLVCNRKSKRDYCAYQTTGNMLCQIIDKWYDNFCHIICTYDMTKNCHMLLHFTYTTRDDLLFMCALFRDTGFKRIIGSQLPRGIFRYWFCNCSKWIHNISLVNFLQEGRTVTHFSSMFPFYHLYHINKKMWCSTASNICRKKKKIATTHTSWNIIVERKCVPSHLEVLKLIIIKHGRHGRCRLLHCFHQGKP